MRSGIVLLAALPKILGLEGRRTLRYYDSNRHQAKAEARTVAGSDRIVKASVLPLERQVQGSRALAILDGKTPQVKRIENIDF